jgi:hypothetical protein
VAADGLYPDVVAVGSIGDGALYRYPACDSYQISVWFYRDARGIFYPEHHSMAQKDRAQFRGVCIQLTLHRPTINFPPTEIPAGPRT